MAARQIIALLEGFKSSTSLHRKVYRLMIMKYVYMIQLFWLYISPWFYDVVWPKMKIGLVAIIFILVSYFSYVVGNSRAANVERHIYEAEVSYHEFVRVIKSTFKILEDDNSWELFSIGITKSTYYPENNLVTIYFEKVK